MRQLKQHVSFEFSAMINLDLNKSWGGGGGVISRKYTFYLNMDVLCSSETLVHT
jgi:hypothetical protein